MSYTYLNADEAAQFLKLKKSYLYKLTSRKAIRFFKPGGKKLLFKEADLIDYMERYEEGCHE